MTTTSQRQSSRFGANPGGRGGGQGGGGRAAQNEPSPPQAGGGKKSLLIVLIVVLLLGGGVGAYFLFFAKSGEPQPPTGGDIVTMEPMTLSLADAHYLKIQVAVELVAGEASAAEFETSHAAELIIDMFSNRTVDYLASNEVRKDLSAELLTDIQQAYPGKVFNLYLTQFVLQ